MDKYTGKRLDGRFDIIRLIGSGGMADVYKANDLLENKLVAVKILKKEYSENEEFLRRFRNESRAIAVLSHPNIVKIIDVGFTNKVQYIAMEYIDGITLKSYMELEKVMDWQTASYFMLQILRGLGHAHEKGIVHQDVKPQNIMLLEDGGIKVMDFGIAKFARDEGFATSAQAIGSVHYISPEQVSSDKTDAKSDIYSAGILFYEMLTGVKPFDNENPITVALMHMQAKPAKPCDVNPDIPKGLEKIILKAIEKDPAKRYSNVSQMINDIEKFKECPENFSGYYEEEKEYVMERDNQSKKDLNSTRSFRTVDSDSRMNMNDTVKETGYDDYDNDGYVPDNTLPAVEEEYIEKRSMFVPMLAGVVIVVIIIATIFIAGLMLNYFGNESDYKEFSVQNFVGQDYDNAKKLFSQYLVFEVKETINSPMPANTILEQDLEPGEVVKPGHKICVVLSKGPKMIEVPPLDNGFTESQAKAILEEKKFSSQTRLVYSDTVQEGYVIKTEPEANTECKEGTTVLLFISRGKMTTQVRLPDVNGKKEDEARKTLEDLELVVETQQRNSQMPEGTIVGMSLTANTLIQTGTKVTIYVSTGLPPTLTHEITIPFPEDANGVFAFKIYVDGTLNSEARDVDSKYTRSKNLSISASGGEKEITIYLVNQGNGKEAELGRYSYSFDESKTKKQLSEDITGAFREVDGLKAAQPPVTQAPPPVTQAPPPETQAPEPEQTETQETQAENQDQQNSGE